MLFCRRSITVGIPGLCTVASISPTKGTMRLKKVVVLLLAICLQFAPLAFVHASLESPTGYDTLLVNTDGTNRPYFPGITKAANGDLLAVYYWNSVHVGTSKGIIRMVRSTDDGASWGTPVTLVDWRAQDLDVRDPHINKMSDGTLVLSFFSYRYNDPTGVLKGSHFAKSTDGGATWSTPVTVSTAHATSGTVIEGANGEYIFPMYGGDDSYVKKSADGGVTWGSLITVASSASEVFNETTLAYVGNNTIYALMRENGKIYRSTDNGDSWSLFTATGLSTHAPDFLVLDSTHIFTTWCRPGSYNGNRAVEGKIYSPEQGWNATPTRLIYNSTGTNVGDMGYSGSVLTDTGRLLTIYYDSYRGILAGTFTDVEDYDGNSYDTFESGTAGQVPKGYMVAGANGTVSGAQAYAGTKSLRIYDNSSSVLTNVVRQTNATPTKTLEFHMYPVAGTKVISLSSGGNNNANAVFHIGFMSDGSIQYYNGSAWTSLAAAGTVAANQWQTVTIEANNTTSARVYLNGTFKGTAGNWNTFQAMDRVRFMSGGTTATGDDYYVDNVSFSNEDTFEYQTAGQVPSGYTEAGANGKVSSAFSYAGTKSLRIYDTSSSVLTNVVKTTTATSSKVFQARIFPVSGANIVSINSGGNNNTESVFHIGIMSDGSLQYYNGAAWSTIAAAGTASANAWHTLTIEAYNTTNANVFLDGAYKGKAGKWNTFATMDRVRFMSGGTAATGDDFYVDNVRFN